MTTHLRPIQLVTATATATEKVQEAEQWTESAVEVDWRPVRSVSMSELGWVLQDDEIVVAQDSGSDVEAALEHQSLASRNDQTRLSAHVTQSWLANVSYGQELRQNISFMIDN